MNVYNEVFKKLITLKKQSKGKKIYYITHTLHNIVSYLVGTHNFIIITINYKNLH